jgi:hypothetical protein
MLAQRIGLSFILMTGCDGGGGSPAVDATVVFDGVRDSITLCTVMPNIGSFDVMVATPQDFIDTNRPGALAGRTVLTFGGRLPTSTAAAVDMLVIDYVKPTGGFALDTPISFDPDPRAAPYVAASYVFGDVDVSTMTAVQMYYANSGSLTMTAAGETSGAAIKGTVGMTNYREIDETGGEVPGGCSSSLTSFTIDGFHNGMNFASPTGDAGGLQALSREEWAAINQVNRRRSRLRSTTGRRRAPWPRARAGAGAASRGRRR